MLYDVITITQKDLKEIFVQRGSLRSGIANLLIVIFITGIMFPLQFGKDWLFNPISMITVAWLPMFMSMGLIADAFAGERERHTLETLLASRLSDQAILFGKLAAAVLYALIIIVASLALGAVTVNVQFPGAGFYPLGTLAGTIVFVTLGALLISGIGVQVSLHASNVRQAYQRMSIGFLVLWLPIILAPQVLPEGWKQQINLWAEGLNMLQVALAFGVGFILVDLALVALGLARFQRSRLILD